MVPEEGIEPTHSQGVRDFETDSRRECPPKFADSLSSRGGCVSVNVHERTCLDMDRRQISGNVEGAMRWPVRCPGRRWQPSAARVAEGDLYGCGEERNGRPIPPNAGPGAWQWSACLGGSYPRRG